jgi:phytoene synthase
VSDDPELDREAAAVMARVARTFDVAARLLPRDRRRDVRRLYLVLRTLDDLVDRGHPAAAARIEDTERWARGVGGSGPEARVLEELAGRHPALPRDAVLDFCAGMRADLVGPRHLTDDDLDRYCYQVAGTVGRLMAALLAVRPGPEEGARADTAARALGRAMQRTNVLRDIVEDARAGRVYLPASALSAVSVAPGCEADELAAIAAWPRDRRRALLAPQIARADADYESGSAGIDSLRTGRRAIVAAARLYQEILRQIERDDYGARGRAVVGRWRKARIVVSSLTGAQRG